MSSNKSILTGSLILLAFGLVQCASSGHSVFSSSSSSKKFELRSSTEQTLPNGLKLIFIKDSSLPKTRISAQIRMGAWNDPKGLEGLSTITGRLLEDGTTNLNATQIADQLSYMGAELSVGTSHEVTWVTASTLSLNRAELLKIYQELLLTPALPEKDLNRRKAQTLAGLAKISEDPSSYADILISQAVFPDHPYGRLVSGNLNSIPKIKRSDVVRQYFKYVRPNNTSISVSGDFDEAYQNQVVAAFSKWAQGKVDQEARPVQGERPKAAMKLVSKPGLKQTQIRWGHLGIHRKDPDFLALNIGNLILGQSFTSRLNQKIRDDLGLTYGISSQFQAPKERGIFEITTFCSHEKTNEVLKQTRNVLNEFIESGITSSELESAKTLMIAQFPASLETSGQLANTLQNYDYQGLPVEELRNFMDRVNAVSKSQVNEAIRKHIFPNQLQVVIYSDKAKILDSLVALTKETTADTKAGGWPAVEVEDLK